jgi:threonine dehydrogenase-like Zn-dependent dehydrogenase
MARRMGAKRVIGVDLQAHRLAIAGRYGATDTLHNANLGIDATTEALAQVTDGQLADVVIEAAGEAESINLAYNLIKIDGDVLYFGVPRAEQIMVDFETFFFKFPRVKAVCNAMREEGQTSTKLALDLIGSGELDVGPILTHSFPFDQVMEAYELQNSMDEGAIKIVIEMPD